MSSTDEFVLDNSVVMAWGFDDEADPYADNLLGLIPSARAYVPSLWPLEVANVLLVGERRQRITAADTSRFLSLLGTFPITVDDETTAHAWGETLSLARAQKLSAYDAAYLELAMRRGLPLATLDAKLKATAAAVGVTLYSP
ncbi:type II toxin-antitoxin system VapC family toxin [Paludisphaera mucosa]|uniref:Type II toxin-antitoxin system VapC family toxin n=1 Tax=Paludisphaera mucosa TaxID=3030827 RepID=A0ABT6FLZ3_9BACT|nr:type II toxin-antitoxin system VapC family toxin [Paludisphaera mucosa]MDG3008395.1 type II toxin-antitoxin system VapC family toxin [Paludisphaera mucosa]